MKTFEFETTKGKLCLTCTETIEPNNGRMLYRVKLSLGTVDLTAQYFGAWNCIVWYLPEYRPVSLDKKWFYVPKEGDHFLIDTARLQKVVLPPLNVSAVSFIGNYFTETHLVIVGSYEVILKSLTTGAVQVLKQPDEEVCFTAAALLDADTIRLSLRDGSHQVLRIDSLKP